MPNRNIRAARDYSPLDRLLIGAQQRLRPPQAAGTREALREDYPAQAIREAPLPRDERRHAAGLMRVNHAGEVSAQALYLGQALVARDTQLREHLQRAASEERAHLDWCAQRLRELDERPSVLSPLWYAGSFAIGAAAGLAGDRWNLGFVEETERQVVEHLDEHLGQLPASDARSRAVVEAMKKDEARHCTEAHEAGARSLPMPVRHVMAAVSKLMKFGAYRI